MNVYPLSLRAILSIALMLVALSFNLATQAEQTPPNRALTSLVKDWNLVLERGDKAMTRNDLPDEKLSEIRQELLALRIQISAAVAEAAPQAQMFQDELGSLGAPPAEDAAPESAPVAAKRKAITDQLSAVEGAMKESDLVLTRANRLLAEINTLQRERYTRRILTQGQSPLSPSVWNKAAQELNEDIELTRLDLRYWLNSDEFSQQGGLLARNLSFGLVAAFILVWPLRNWLLRRYGYVGVETEPTHGQRLRAALFTGFIRILLPTAATVAVYLALNSTSLMSANSQGLVDTALSALVFLYAVAAFCHAALAPLASDWRLVAIGDHGARVISRVVTAIAVVFALDQIVDELRVQFEASLELTLIHQFISGLFISALLLVLLQPPIWIAAASDCTDPARPWRRLRFFLRILVLGIPLSAVLGFVAMSRLLATQLVLTAGLYVAVMVVREMAEEAVEQALSRQSAMGQRLRATFSLSDEGSEILRFWISEILGALIVVAGVLLMLVLWGAGGDDLVAWLHTALFGFKVGNITISLADLMMALLFFAALLAITRLFQHWLEQRIFPRTRLDAGIRHSIRSATGYLGFTLATVVGVSTIGIDLSNLAMIAGALSVGIGFGLQNIVNNFVSGLILLVERPIKVGDWVIVGDHQGYVKRISVRATEISTFDRASVFIPNSSLISGPVMNRTYADKVGRVVLNLALPQGTDSRRVRELLLNIAEQQGDLLHNPAPAVAHKGYADNMLHMELVAFVRDVDKVKAVSSDLWFDIEACFRAEGISLSTGSKDIKVIVPEERVLSMLANWVDGKSKDVGAVDSNGRDI